MTSTVSVCLSVCQLMGHLPARAEGSSWHLLYSSSVHGCSLRTLYRQMMGVDSPILLVVMDTQHHVSLSVSVSSLCMTLLHGCVFSLFLLLLDGPNCCPRLTFEQQLQTIEI